MGKPEHFKEVMTEILGPLQVITSYNDESLEQVLEACERMSHHLTAAVVSNDVRFQDKVLGRTVNGTTYAGIRARTTGAPQNNWFGPVTVKSSMITVRFQQDGSNCHLHNPCILT